MVQMDGYNEFAVWCTQSSVDMWQTDSILLTRFVLLNSFFIFTIILNLVCFNLVYNASSLFHFRLSRTQDISSLQW